MSFLRSPRVKNAATIGFGFFLMGCALYTTLEIGLHLGIGEVWSGIAAAAAAGLTMLFIDRD